MSDNNAAKLQELLLDFDNGMLVTVDNERLDRAVTFQTDSKFISVSGIANLSDDSERVRSTHQSRHGQLV